MSDYPSMVFFGADTHGKGCKKTEISEKKGLTVIACTNIVAVVVRMKGRSMVISMYSIFYFHCRRKGKKDGAAHPP